MAQAALHDERRKHYVEGAPLKIEKRKNKPTLLRRIKGFSNSRWWKSKPVAFAAPSHRQATIQGNDARGTSDRSAETNPLRVS
jgi:hypothetical protein